jgi:hypothetical protein
VWRQIIYSIFDVSVVWRQIIYSIFDVSVVWRQIIYSIFDVSVVWRQIIYGIFDVAPARHVCAGSYTKQFSSRPGFIPSKNSLPLSLCL